MKRHLFGWSRPSVSPTVATLAWCFIFAPAIAAEPGLKLPPVATETTPAQPPLKWKEGEPGEQRFYVLPVSALRNVSEIIENMLREIQRLEAIVNKGSCT